MKKINGKKLFEKIQEKRENFYNPTFRNPLRMRNGLWIGFLIFSAIAALKLHTENRSRISWWTLHGRLLDCMERRTLKGVSLF